MILVDVFVPELDQTYDLQVDETVKIGKVILEIAEIISNKVQAGADAEASNFLLCSMDQNMILKKTASLSSYGIKNGSRLMLV